MTGAASTDGPTPGSTAGPTPAPAPRGGFRPELHGIRGLALTLVVVFHVLGNGRISGGIDVFLAITGFLVTGSLLRRAVAGGGRIRLRAHYGRIAQRLLPPLLLVAVAVAVGGVLLLPSSRWESVARELLASVLYYENWELIASQLSYEAAGPATSPLQHIWSLSIQGQMHLVWPFVVMAAVLVARRLRRDPTVVLGVGLGVAVVASLAYAIDLGARDHQVAYFHTGARVWELALGGLAALVLPRLRLPRTVRVVLGWVGLALVASCGLLLDGAALFPGPAALWPIGGLLLVLAAGTTGERLAADRLLGSRPLHVVGDLSYALYLWHWPVLIATLVLTRRDRLTWVDAVVVLALSTALAWATHHGLEARTAPGPRTAPVGARPSRVLPAVLGTTAVLALGFGTSVAALERDEEDLRAELAALAEDVGRPGAATMADGTARFEPGVVLDADAVVPSVAAVLEDLPEIYHHGCIQNGQEGTAHAAVKVCEDDVPGARATVVLSGGSHVVQWWPALEIVAERNAWELVVIDKSGCRLTADRDASRGMDHYQSCYDWNEAAFDEIVRRAPDAVVTLGSTTKTLGEETPPGMVDVWADLGEAGVPVVALRDTTRFRESVPDCLEREGMLPVECGQPRDEVLTGEFPQVDDVPGSVAFVDMTPYLCTDDVCPAIIGDVVVYRDSSHVSATYMRTLAPYLEAELRRAAPWLFADDTDDAG